MKGTGAGLWDRRVGGAGAGWRTRVWQKEQEQHLNLKTDTRRQIIIKQAVHVILAHLRSGQEPESDRVWRVRVKGSGWGSQRGCHSTTGGNPKRSYGCSAWAEEAFAWTASSRCYADGCIISGKGQDVSADGFHTDFRRKHSIIASYDVLHCITR